MKKLIFDFDGTLVDSMEKWGQAMIDTLEANKISYPDDIIKIVTPLGYSASARYFKEDLGLDKPIREIYDEILSRAIYEYTHNVSAKQTIENSLNTLKQRGYSLNVLTASPHEILDVCLKRLELYDLFDNVWSCEDFKTTKSDINIYVAAAKKLGCTTEDCIFFDDNVVAVKTAKKSGMTVVGVYDKSSEAYINDIKNSCDMYIYTLDEYIKNLGGKPV